MARLTNDLSARQTASRPASRATARTKAAAARAARARRMAAVVAFARKQVGKPYRWGATGPGAYDCSGFTRAAYLRGGWKLAHSSRAQARRAYRISWAAARPGDLVTAPGHVGIYMGKRNGHHMIIDAGNSRVGVVYRRAHSRLRPQRIP